MDTLYRRIGRRIKEAREALGLTQEGLAKAVERVTGQPMTAVKISYFETGARHLKIEDLPVFAKALGKFTDYFLTETELASRSESVLNAVLFRATRTLNPSSKRQIEEIVDVFLNSSVQEGYSLPLIPRKTPAEILAFLEVSQPPVEPIDVAYASGVVVDKRSLDDSISGVVVLVEGHTAIILNRSQSEVQIRFTTAHELGHLWLGHYPQVEVALNMTGPFSRAPLDPLMERQADQFAAELLMPEAWLRDDWRKCAGDIDRMAGLYRVSRQAMWERLIETGFVVN